VFNLFEAEIVVHGFLRRLVCEYQIPGLSIGVICLYQAQKAKVVALMQELSSYPDAARFKDEFDAVQISTVDAFQGAEKQVIILATTKTSRSSFVESGSRLNVALTRGKSTLIAFVLFAAILLTRFHLETTFSSHATSQRFQQLLPGGRSFLMLGPFPEASFLGPVSKGMGS
jgi:hypothetical protein